MAPVKVFVAACGNQFMTEIAGWIAEAAALTGRSVETITSRLPAIDGTINLVVAPHEFFELHHASPRALQRAAAASVCLNTEQPGTSWFSLALDACRRGLLTLDMSDQGLHALTTQGVRAQRLRLGGVPSMRRVAETDERPIDVLFMGGLDDRRGAILADLAPRLWRLNVDLRLAGGDRPIGAATPQAVFGADKQRLLASSKIVLNVHRGRRGGEEHPPYFEWARAIEAMANGCVVLTEPSDGCEPLKAGTHFVEATAEDMAAQIERLLADENERTRIASAARSVILDELALDRSLAPLLDKIEGEVLPRLDSHSKSSATRKGRWHLGLSSGPQPVRLGAFRPYLPTLAEAKRIAMAENSALRRLDAAECQLAHGSVQHVTCFETPVLAGTKPEVSVVVSLYNYAGVVVEALSSVAASEGIAFELIVVEDHAADNSREVVQQFMIAHPDVPMMLVAKDANEGLAAARNTGFDHARAALVMVMDADNTIYPTCLRKLADALHANPDVDAAYAILEDFGEQRNIRSALAWDVQRLCRANYIDAQAMLRKTMWERLGGYRADDELVYGWEDWDLWLRLANGGGQALLVTQILGRYRTQQGSMIALTNLATDDAIAAMRVRYPNLPWPTTVRP